MTPDSPLSQTVPKRRCLFCRREFDLTRKNRVYCRAACRKSAFELRQEVTAKPAAPGLSRDRVKDEIGRARAVTSGPPLEQAVYLEELAAFREAQELARLWSLRMGARKARLERLTPPAVEVRLQIIRSPAELVAPLPNEDRLGVACSSSELAVVAYGRR